jgi:hypothetical protein
MSTNAMNTAANAQAADAPGELIDPTGIPAGQTVQPALRLPELEGRRLLLLDNGKLGVGAYAVVADALRTGVPEATWAQATINLLRADDADVEGIADTLIASYQPDACVLALADAGVTAHTALLSMALERHGIPAVMLGTPLGAGLGGAMFRARAPNLEVVVLDIVRTDSQAKAIALTAAAVPRIRALLTSDVAPQTPERASPYPAEAARQWASAATAMASFQDWAEQAGIGDGLPLIPPTAGAVAAHLTTVDADPDALVYGPALT